MRTLAQFLGTYTGEILITAAGVIIRKIELSIIRRKERKAKKKADVGTV